MRLLFKIYIAKYQSAKCGPKIQYVLNKLINPTADSWNSLEFI